MPTKMHKDTYWTLFEGYIHPQTNQLLAVVELKRLFQGSLSLEDFHMKALRLVAELVTQGPLRTKCSEITLSVDLLVIKSELKL